MRRVLIFDEGGGLLMELQQVVERSLIMLQHEDWLALKQRVCSKWGVRSGNMSIGLLREFSATVEVESHHYL